MDNTYLGLFSKRNQELIREIEEVASQNISVHVAPDKKTHGSSCEYLLVEKKIDLVLRIPNPSSIPNGSATHELLHLKRFVIDGAPRLVPGFEQDDVHPRLLQDIDNALEHIVIIPEELVLCPERGEYWKNKLQQFLSDFKKSTDLGEIDKFGFLLRFVLIRVLSSCPTLQNESTEVAITLGIKTEADEFASALVAACPSKENMIKACVNAATGSAKDLLSEADLTYDMNRGYVRSIKSL